MPDSAVWIRAVRDSHDRFANAVSPLDLDAIRNRSYASEWSIAETASHLGSQAEIFALFLDAGLTGAAPPGGDDFGPIWDVWNAKSATDQVADSVRVNAAFVDRLEQLSDDERAAFQLSLFGMELDLSGVLAMRLGEHAVHTWDVLVALDPAAVLAPDAVALLAGTIATTAGRAGKPAETPETLLIETSEPQRFYSLVTGPSVELSDSSAGSADLQLPTEAFIRLVYGRLDPGHTPAGIENPDVLVRLREVFPGF